MAVILYLNLIFKQTLGSYYKYMDALVIDIFNVIGIKCDNIASLDGVMIPREQFLNTERYEEIQGKLGELKKYLSSSSLTSLFSVTSGGSDAVMQQVKSCVSMCKCRVKYAFACATCGGLHHVEYV